MSKYGSFEVVRTERLPVKKKSDHQDADGKREYSFLSCPHCKHELQIPTSILLSNKSLTIRNHITICKEYNGEVPTKRLKNSSESSSTEHNCVTYTWSVQKSSKIEQPNEMETLKQEIADLRERHEKYQEKSTHEISIMKDVLSRHQMYWGCVATSFGYTPPQDPPFLIDKIRELRQQQPVLL